MTQDEVLARLEAIRAVADDDERAHGMEDQLLYDVLGAIAAGAENPQELARTAITAAYIKFARWCA